MTKRLNAFYSMWVYSAVDRNCWEYRCQVNNVKGDLIDIAELIESDFENQFLYGGIKDSFGLKGIGFYPNEVNIVPAILNVFFEWDDNKDEWNINSYQIIDDNLNDVAGGDNITILGRNV